MDATLRWLVDRMHVSTSDIGVVREIARRARKMPKPMRKEAYRQALTIHHENQELYRYVVRGR